MSESLISGLYAITPELQNTGDLLRRVHLALQGGARVIQYRNKLGSVAQRLEQAHALRALTYQFSVPFIINDDAVLVMQVEADGVHIGAEDGSVAAARMMMGNGKIIGVSCYNQLNLAHEASELGADYAAFGAFFSSPIKPAAPVATRALLRQARRELSLPLVAIGGITLENGGSLREAGATALAVISALFNAKDILSASKQFTNLNT
ncbi:MAG: thiamine phosphate synthase [Gallionella sp.]